MLSEKIASYGLKEHSLGKALPPSPHSIFASLPKMADILAYEEGEIETKKKMQAGYPRFVNPSYSKQLEGLINQEKGLCTRLLSSPKIAPSLAEYLNIGKLLKIHQENGLTWVSFPQEEKIEKKVQEFLQHSGAMVFSREAEDHLVKRTKLNNVFHEERKIEKSTATIKEQIAKDIYEKVNEQNLESIFLARSGMTAFFTAFQGLSQIQKKYSPKRKIWIQLGWLYIDTVCILSKFKENKNEHVHLRNTFDLDTLFEFLKKHPSQVAGVVCEFPTNPLLQCTNIERLALICQKAEVALIIDTSLVGLSNTKVLPYADIQICSLTKYYSWSADVIMGASIINPKSLFYSDIKSYLRTHTEEPYVKDVQRLAYLTQEYPKVMTRINQNTMNFVHFLEKKKEIQNIYWVYKGDSSFHYSQYAKKENSPGSLVSFDLKIPSQPFYDRIQVAKGPSFGVSFSILCPYLYLAHYELVKSKKGRAYLKENQLSANTLRFSLGIENLDKICEHFSFALKSS